jgi:hypothetical protein
MRDVVVEAHASAVWGFFGLALCWIVSVFIYGFSIFLDHISSSTD